MVDRLRQPLLCCLLLALFAPPGASVAQEVSADDVVDFSTVMTPTCELAGLVARPPEGWFSVPLEGLPAGLTGCQMMRADEAQVLVGIARLVSEETGETPPGEESVGQIVARELQFVGSLGYAVGDEPLWARQDVPIRGAGFSNARAVALPVTIEEAGGPWELHLLVFQSEAIQYLISLTTPSKALGAADYERNTADFGTLIRTLDFPVPAAGSGSAVNPR